jgi:hypothetical protein
MTKFDREVVEELALHRLAFKGEWVRVDTSDNNQAIQYGTSLYWCPEKAMWLAKDHMVKCADGWYAKGLR